MDAIYHRTHLGDSLLHALQHLCVAGELEGAEARRIIADFNEVRLQKLRVGLLAARSMYARTATAAVPLYLVLVKSTAIPAYAASV